MTTDTANTQKFLVNIQDGTNNLERATTAFIIATASSNTNETAIFITSDAAQLATIGGADGLVSEGMEPLADLIKQYQSNGGKIWLCKICAKIKGITEDDLLEGAAIVGAPKCMEYLTTGGKVLF